MIKFRKILISFLLMTFSISLIAPGIVSASGKKFGVIIGDKSNHYKLYNNLTVMSPTNNIMIKAYSVSKALGFYYSYNKTTNKITIKNPSNGKYLVFRKGSKSYTYYSSNTATGVVKTATYPVYYDKNSRSNVIHITTLKYIVGYNFYNNSSDTYYSEMGYGGLIVYSVNGYSRYDIPITEEVVNYVNAKKFTTKESLLDAVRLNFLARKSEITLNTTKGVMNEIGTKNSILDFVKNIDKLNTSKDSDYFSLLIDSMRQNWQSTTKTIIHSNGTRELVYSPEDPATLSIEVRYETTLLQERIVDSKIAEILKSLKLGNATEYEKVKAIHDYIINLASYDTTYQKSSAYDLLILKTAVCEGYTLAAYRLFIDAGLESRIITGKGGGEEHAWNIVKVDGAWYNIDLTWDDPLTSSGKPMLRYDFFLKNEADFTDHVRDAEYRTKEFLAAYPIAAGSYVK